MPATQILEQAGKLHSVSQALNALAKEQSPAAEALTVMARTIRNSAMVLEVMVAVKLGIEPRLGEPIN
jgi:hypothetical protein